MAGILASVLLFFDFIFLLIKYGNNFVMQTFPLSFESVYDLRPEFQIFVL